MVAVAVELANVPERVPGIVVADGEPKKPRVILVPTGILLACTTTLIGSGSWLGNRRSTVSNRVPEPGGTAKPPIETMVNKGSALGTIAGLMVERTAGG